MKRKNKEKEQMVNEDWVSKGNASFAHGMKNDSTFFEAENNCSMGIGHSKRRLSAQQRRTGQILVSTEKESTAKLMACHGHTLKMRNALTSDGMGSHCVYRQCPSVRFEWFFLLRSQYVIVFISSSFDIITLIIDILVEQKNEISHPSFRFELFVDRTCSTPIT